MAREPSISGRPPGFATRSRAIATSLGPRDDAWLEAAVGDSRLAIDVTPWWADATDARYLLNRALCLMWTEVRWRPPADDDERHVHEEVLRLLARAFPLDPSLDYPWRAWHELVRFRGRRRDDPPGRSAGAAVAAGPPIGYRRGLGGPARGLGLEVPGSFSEQRTADEWTGRGSGRSITIAATETGTVRPHERPGRSSTRSRRTSAPTRCTTTTARSSGERVCRPTRRPASKSACSRATQRCAAGARRSGSSSTTRRTGAGPSTRGERWRRHPRSSTPERDEARLSSLSAGGHVRPTANRRSRSTKLVSRPRSGR